MLLLDVPYEEKEEAKALGAHWNPEYKKWSVNYGKDYRKFDKWISKTDGNTILCDYIYVIVGQHKCFRCERQTSVVGLGIEKFFSIHENEDGSRRYEFNNDGIHIYPFPLGMPKDLLNFLDNKFRLRYDYSKFIDDSYMANHCCNCGVIQGNFFLFEEVDSPFFVKSPSDVKKLSVFKYKLPYDILCRSMLRICSTDKMIKEYADIQELLL